VSMERELVAMMDARLVALRAEMKVALWAV